MGSSERPLKLHKQLKQFRHRIEKGCPLVKTLSNTVASNSVAMTPRARLPFSPHQKRQAPSSCAILNNTNALAAIATAAEAQSARKQRTAATARKMYNTATHENNEPFGRGGRHALARYDHFQTITSVTAIPPIPTSTLATLATASTTATTTTTTTTARRSRVFHQQKQRQRRDWVRTSPLMLVTSIFLASTICLLLVISQAQFSIAFPQQANGAGDRAEAFGAPIKHDFNSISSLQNNTNDRSDLAASDSSSASQKSVVASLSSAVASAAAAAAVAAAQNSLSGNDARSLLSGSTKHHHSAPSNHHHQRGHQYGHAQRSPGLQLAIKLVDTIPEVPYNILHNMKKLDHAAPFYNVPQKMAHSSASKKESGASFLGNALSAAVATTASGGSGLIGGGNFGQAAEQLGVLLRSPLWKRIADGYGEFTSEFRSLFRAPAPTPMKGTTGTTSKLLRDISVPALLMLLATTMPADWRPLRTRRKSLAPPLELAPQVGSALAAQVAAAATGAQQSSFNIGGQAAGGSGDGGSGGGVSGEFSSNLIRPPSMYSSGGNLNSNIGAGSDLLATRPQYGGNTNQQAAEPPALPLNGAANWHFQHQMSAQSQLQDALQQQQQQQQQQQHTYQHPQSFQNVEMAEQQLYPTIQSQQSASATSIRRSGEPQLGAEQSDSQVGNVQPELVKHSTAIKVSQPSKPLFISTLTHAVASILQPLQQQQRQSATESGSFSSASSTLLPNHSSLLLAMTKQMLNGSSKVADFQQFIGDKTANHQQVEQRDLSLLLPQSWREVVKRTMSSVQHQAGVQWKSIEGQLANWVRDKIKTALPSPAAGASGAAATAAAATAVNTSSTVAPVAATAVVSATAN